MSVEATIRNIIDNLAPAAARNRKIQLPNDDISEGELVTVLGILAKEYNTTLPNLLKVMDRVSGDLGDLEKFYSGDTKVEWTEEQDKLIGKNDKLLEKWKGVEATERRKKYLAMQ